MNYTEEKEVTSLKTNIEILSISEEEVFSRLK